LAPGTMIVGARCHPGLAPSLLGLPASELLNQTVPPCARLYAGLPIIRTGESLNSASGLDAAAASFSAASRPRWATVQKHFNPFCASSDCSVLPPEPLLLGVSRSSPWTPAMRIRRI
jgi:hypothetical protein